MFAFQREFVFETRFVSWREILPGDRRGYLRPHALRISVVVGAEELDDYGQVLGGEWAARVRACVDAHFDDSVILGLGDPARLLFEQLAARNVIDRLFVVGQGEGISLARLAHFLGERLLDLLEVHPSVYLLSVALDDVGRGESARWCPSYVVEEGDPGHADVHDGESTEAEVVELRLSRPPGGPPG